MRNRSMALVVRDRAFLWSRGLVEVDDFFELAWSWGDEISYPIG